MNIENYIYVNNSISKKDCSIICSSIKNRKKQWERHTWYSYSTNSTETHKEDSDILYANEEDNKILLPYIFKELQTYHNLKSTIKENVSWITRHSSLRFNLYKKNNCMKPHYDHIHSLFDGKEKGIPILTVVGVLNDEYDGGDFFVCNKKINTQAGSIIIFPSLFMFPHEVKKITKGIRMSFVCWLY